MDSVLPIILGLVVAGLLLWVMLRRRSIELPKDLSEDTRDVGQSGGQPAQLGAHLGQGTQVAETLSREPISVHPAATLDAVQAPTVPEPAPRKSVAPAAEPTVVEAEAPPPTAADAGQRGG